MSQDSDAHEEGATAPSAQADNEPIEFSEFLETVPPNTPRAVAVVTEESPGSITAWRICSPQLHLHCTSPECNGLRFFRRSENSLAISRKEFWSHLFIHYNCSNCMVSVKTFAVLLVHNKKDHGALCTKLGESPPFGPPTPARLMRLFGPERENYLKGRRCESQGLGIGAFTYYRRVVENQRTSILDAILRVARQVNASPASIKLLEDAIKEHQFTTSIESVKDAVPESLLISGHNPLKLLHSALSDGVHNLTDEDCLSLAHDVRVILTELADRIGIALKDQAELNSAVSRLQKPKSKSNN